MAKNIYNLLNAKQIIKIGFYVPSQEKLFDKFTGRKAHITILENHFLIKIIINQLKDLFK